MDEKVENRKSKNAIAYNKENYKRISLNCNFADYERLKTYCNTHSLKVNTFIKLCIEKCMSEGFSPTQPEHKSYYNKKIKSDGK